MSPKEIAIAEAAIKPYSASDYEDLHKQIAQATGYSIEDVDGVIDDCTADKTLFARIEPMLDQIAGRRPPAMFGRMSRTLTLNAWFRCRKLQARLAP
jgi:hypothetical protein